MRKCSSLQIRLGGTLAPEEDAASEESVVEERASSAPAMYRPKPKEDMMGEQRERKGARDD